MKKLIISITRIIVQFLINQIVKNICSLGRATQLILSFLQNKGKIYLRKWKLYTNKKSQFLNQYKNILENYSKKNLKKALTTWKIEVKNKKMMIIQNEHKLIKNLNNDILQIITEKQLFFVQACSQKSIINL